VTRFKKSFIPITHIQPEFLPNLFLIFSFHLRF